MPNPFFEQPILNSPYGLPQRHWELDSDGQPTQRIIDERRKDAKEKKSTMDNYWIPGVNQLKTYGRWAFAEFTDVYEIESDFATKVAACFDEMIGKAVRP